MEIIENEFWRLTIHPRLGASPTCLEAKIDGVWHNIMRPTPTELLAGDSSSPFSSYTLAPWSNRIPGGRFRFANHDFEVRINSPKEQVAIHGDVKDRPWKVLNHGSSLECTFDSREFPDVNFPFPFVVRVEHVFEDQKYITKMHLENVGDTPMPAGMGIHPYFVRELLGINEPGTNDPQLQFKATGVYLTDKTKVPSKAASPIPPELDFSAATAITDQVIDHVYAGWDGQLTFNWGTHRMTMRASPVFTHFVLFTGAPDRSIALEPVTHSTNAFNLGEQGVEGIGHRVLEPGQVLEGNIELTLD
jgi:aldose 1-epimerase